MTDNEFETVWYLFQLDINTWLILKKINYECVMPQKSLPLCATYTSVATHNWVIKNKLFYGIPLDFELKQTSNCKKYLSKVTLLFIQPELVVVL